jgi:hypothetical protein
MKKLFVLSIILLQISVLSLKAQLSPAHDTRTNENVYGAEWIHYYLLVDSVYSRRISTHYYTLPSAAGTTGQVLKSTNGSGGTVAWSTVVGPSGATGPTGITGPSGAQGTTGPSGDRYATTSTTSLNLGTIGVRAVTGGTGLAWTMGQSMVIAYDASDYFNATVMSYDPATGAFVVNLDQNIGSGIQSGWAINLNGPIGPTGPSGDTYWSESGSDLSPINDDNVIPKTDATSNLGSRGTYSPGTKASWTGTLAGMTTPVTVDADNVGLAGNVTLNYNGTTKISITIWNWNVANPSNTVKCSSGDSTQVPDNKEKMILSGGTDPGYVGKHWLNAYADTVHADSVATKQISTNELILNTDSAVYHINNTNDSIHEYMVRGHSYISVTTRNGLPGNVTTPLYCIYPGYNGQILFISGLSVLISIQSGGNVVCDGTNCNIVSGVVTIYPFGTLQLIYNGNDTNWHLVGDCP